MFQIAVKAKQHRFVLTAESTFRNGRSEVKYLENMRINGACRGMQRDGHWNRTSDGLFVVSSVCRFSAPSVRTWSLRRIHASVRSRRLAATICLVRWIPRADLFGVLLPCGRYERFCGVIGIHVPAKGHRSSLRLCLTRSCAPVLFWGFLLFRHSWRDGQSD